MEPIIVLITALNEDECAKIGRALVEENLAACANIIKGVRSIYRWRGDVFDEGECMMVVKTVRANFGRLEKRVRGLHSYELPEIIALPIVKGFEPYLRWVEENTRLG